MLILMRNLSLENVSSVLEFHLAITIMKEHYLLRYQFSKF